MEKLENISEGPRFNVNHLAPCGMNCGTCRAYLRKKNRCGGCRNKNSINIRHCANCAILNCTFLATTVSKFCYECEKYPCLRIKHLDKRYITRYKVSPIKNLEKIKSEGIDAFLKSENIRWCCPDCKGTVCVHTGYCLDCRLGGN